MLIKTYDGFVMWSIIYTAVTELLFSIPVGHDVEGQVSHIFRIEAQQTRDPRTSRNQ